MRVNPIYRNGRFQVVPLIRLINIVEGGSGKVLDTYRVEEIEEAVRMCDEMAERQEERAA
jgi:hypothetical protein